MSDHDRAITHAAVLLATEKARRHLEEAERLVDVALATAEEARAHYDTADHWIEVAAVGARRAGLER